MIRDLRSRLRRHWFGLLCAAVLVFLVVAEATNSRIGPAHWDWLMHSGALVFLVALGAARRIPPAVPVTVRRIQLTDDKGQPADADAVLVALGARRRRYSLIGVPVGIVAMAVVWVWGDSRHQFWANGLFWLELLGAAAAGYVVGGFIAYGRLGSILNALQIRPLAVPGHPDGAAGLRPVGALYLRQAMIVAAIGVFAGVWWLLIPVVGYASWRASYLAIVLVCLVLEAVSLFLPLYTFHQSMEVQRSELLTRADHAAREMSWIDGELGSPRVEPADRAALKAAKEQTHERWREIDTMPTWPIDTRIRRRFAWNNVAMVVPLVLQLVHAPEVLQQLSKALGSLS